MSTFTQIIYQIVFSTKNRHAVLTEPNSLELYLYIGGILKAKRCNYMAINGVEDHLHIITSLHPTIALANLVKDIKVATSLWIKERSFFPGFYGWQEGYGAFTYSVDAKENLTKYVNNQKIHHKTINRSRLIPEG